MIIGGNRKDFWTSNEHEIALEFEAYNERQKRAAQERWEIGAYFKAALNASILVATLADKHTSGSMPKFPEMPFKDDLNEREGHMSKEQLEMEREKAFKFFSRFCK